MRRITILLCMVAMLVFSIASFAQSDTARVVGKITDTSGAAIPGVSVTATNTATGRVITVQTDGAGSYAISSLPPGAYKVEAKATKFKTATANITLQISQVQEISLKLVPGGVEEVINVTGEVPLVETSTSSTGEVIQGRQVTELPLNGRNFTQLALLTPGVTRGAYGNIASGGGTSNPVETNRFADSGGAGLSANGIRPQANNFILDGVDNNESLVNTIVFFPPAEAIEEFRVNTSVAPAEFGRAGGALVQTSIKSGSNQIHGSVFDFVRNDFFDALPFGSTKAVPLRKNQFGATLGGPIWKNKLFFFVDYQGLRQKQPDSVETITVPTAKERIGDFSELLGSPRLHAPVSAACPSASGTGFIWNPMTCQPFAGNIITNPNPVGLKYLQAFPLPNIPSAGAFDNYTVQRRKQLSYNDFDARLDYVFGERDTVFGRYSYGQDDNNETSRLPNLPAGPGSGSNPQHPRGVAAGYIHTFSGSVINEFRFGYNRPFYAYVQPGSGQSLANNLGIPVPNTTPLLGGMALIGGNGGGGEAIEYTGDFGSYSVPQKSFQYLDTVSWNTGRHSFKFGFNVIDRHVDFFQGNRAKGYFQLGGQDYIGAGQYTGFEVSEILAGFVDYQIGNANKYYKTKNYETGYFAQDDFRVNNRLTLNLGLRYDLYTWPYETSDQMSNFDLKTGQIILPSNKSWPRSLIETDKNNLAPRIGFALDMFGTQKWVLRGGYGLFYFLDRGGVGNQLSNNAGFNGFQQYSARNGYRITLSGANPVSATGYTGNVDWTTATGPLPTATLDPANPGNGAAVIAYPRNSQNSDVQQWNLQLEHQLGANMSADIAYVGTKMDHLATQYNANLLPVGGSAVAYPNYSSVTEYAFIGSGHYKGLQARLNRRFAKGLQFTAAYTWSHTTDNSNGAFGGANQGGSDILLGAGGVAQLRLNEGNSASDMRHFFTFSSLYELPFGKGKPFASNVPTAVDYILGGWQWNNIVTIGTGTPFNYTVGIPNAPNGTPSPRPNVVSYKTDQLASWVTNPGARGVAILQWSYPTGGQQGTLARNFFYGPGLHTWDTGMVKNFKITERFNTQFRAEVFNVLNTPQFINPNLVNQGPDISPTVHQTAFATNQTRLNSERQMQFALRVTF